MTRNRVFGFLCAVVSLGLLAGCSGGEGNGGGAGGTGGSGGGGGGEGCRSNVECPAETPACVAGSCVACTDDSGCEGRSALHCSSAQGICVACTADAHCDGRRCTDDNRCVECLTADDCNGGRCDNNICQFGCTANGDCPDGQICMPPEGGAPTGLCAALCDPYAPVCAGERICDFIAFTDDLAPVGACLPANGGAREQEACNPQLCERGLICVTYGAGDQRCTSLCDPDGATSGCGAGFTCVEIDVTTPEGATIGLCVPDTRECDTDADCNADETCVLATDVEGALITICDRAVGPRRGGERCTSHSDCASNFCLAGQQICYGACREETDCHGNSTCVEVNFGLPDGTSQAMPACFPSCEGDTDCNAGQTCILARSFDAESFVRVCNPTNGLLGGGQRCSADSECRSNDCSNGFCFGFCGGPEDCSAETECVDTVYLVSTGGDGRVGTADDRWQSFGTCHGRTCATDSECPGDWVCVPMQDPSERSPRQTLVQRCVGATGNLPGGASCTSADQCASGICFDPRYHPEDCDDGIDNDGDGAVDCEDVDCHDVCFVERDCANGRDDDGDGLIDCADGDCDSQCNYENACGDGIDNDGDGVADCDDPDCDWFCGERDCTNGLDDDGDGFVDCRDDDCDYWSVCREDNLTGQCSDGIDNDDNGYVDCQDPDCRFTSPCNLLVHEGLDTGPEACSDGIDNDGDGLIDCADPGCFLIAPCTERSCAGGGCCADGEDNDGDGRTDCADPDCADDPACHERGRCADGIDNDGDRLADCADPDCASAPNCDESLCAGGNCCTDGRDNDNDGLVDCQDPDCAYTAACRESSCGQGTTACCRDGIDNDRDGRVDCADPDCASTSACQEFSCSDGVDNDNDGAIDCADSDCFGSSSCPRVCFEACEVSADCDVGATCVPGALSVTLDYSWGAWGYANSCVTGP